jgi:hypothetical protein
LLLERVEFPRLFKVEFFLLPPLCGETRPAPEALFLWDKRGGSWRKTGVLARAARPLSRLDCRRRLL